MTADVLAVIDVYATGMQWVTWIWIATALGLTIAGAWLIVAIGRHVIASFARARQVVHEVGPDALRLLQELDTHLDQTVAHDPELAAGYQRLHDAIDQTREEHGQ